MCYKVREADLSYDTVIEGGTGFSVGVGSNVTLTLRDEQSQTPGLYYYYLTGVAEGGATLTLSSYI